MSWILELGGSKKAGARFWVQGLGKQLQEAGPGAESSVQSQPGSAGHFIFCDLHAAAEPLAALLLGEEDRG